MHSGGGSTFGLTIVVVEIPAPEPAWTTAEQFVPTATIVVQVSEADGCGKKDKPVASNRGQPKPHGETAGDADGHYEQPAD